MSAQILKHVQFKNDVIIKDAIGKYGCKHLRFYKKVKCNFYVLRNKAKLVQAIKMYSDPFKVCQSLRKC